MLDAFTQMVKHNGAEEVLKMLEKDFCTIRSIDLNIFSEKPLPLNRFDDPKALILSFKKEAKISICSGVKFYSDKYCYNEIAHVYAAKA